MYGAPSYTYNPQHSVGPAAHLPPTYGTEITPVRGGAVYLAGHAANRVMFTPLLEVLRSCPIPPTSQDQ